MTETYTYRFDDRIAQSLGIDATSLPSGMIGTQNHRGFQMATLSSLFEDWIHGAQEGCPIMDIGTAYGINSLTALHADRLPKDSKVIGLDMDKSHLAYVSQVAEKEGVAGRLLTIFSSLPKLEGVASKSVSSILCSDVIHFLSGEEIKQSLARMYEILTPGGTLSLSCAGIYSNLPFFRERLQKRDPFPTYFKQGEQDWEELQQMMKDRIFKLSGQELPPRALPSQIHFLSVTQLATLVEEQGFVIKFIRQCIHPGMLSAETSPFHHIEMVAMRLREEDLLPEHE